MHSGEVFETLLCYTVVAFHFHISEPIVMWVFYTQIMMSLLVYFDDKVIA